MRRFVACVRSSWRLCRDLASEEKLVVPTRAGTQLAADTTRRVPLRFNAVSVPAFAGTTTLD